MASSETLSTDVLTIGRGSGAEVVPSCSALWRDRRIVVAGGNAQAIAWTLGLLPVAGDVTLVHDNPHFDAAPSDVDAVAAAHASMQIRLVEGAIRRLVEVRGRLRAVHVVTRRGEVVLRADRLVACGPLLPPTDLAATAGPPVRSAPPEPALAPDAQTAPA